MDLVIISKQEYEAFPKINPNDCKMMDVSIRTYEANAYLVCLEILKRSEDPINKLLWKHYGDALLNFARILNKKMKAGM